MSSRSRRPRLLGAIILLILLGLLLPLGSLLTGFLPGGKSRAESVPEPEPKDASGTLQVTVVHAGDLSPVEGAHVLVARLLGGQAEAESDARGRVRLKGLGKGPVRIETTVDGSKAETWADPSVTCELMLAVGPEPRRSGRVAPVPAHVSLLGEDGSELASTDRRTPTRRGSTTCRTSWGRSAPRRKGSRRRSPSAATSCSARAGWSKGT